MKTISFFLVLLAASLSLVPCGARDFSKEVLSPDGNISFQIFNQVHPDGEDLLCYAVKAYGMDAVLPSRLGFEMNGKTYGRNLSLKKVESSEINEEYILMAGKKLKTINRCNESVFTFAGKGGVKFKIAVRVFDDGAAFRDLIPGKGDAVMDKELTEFAIPDGKAWIHPYDWNGRLKPSYEQYCVCGKPVGTHSPLKKGWAFPMLFETGGLWTTVTEAYLDGSYPACHIDNSGNGGAYKIRFPEIEEPVIPDNPRPCSTLPWATPWRAIITGKGLDVIFATQMVQHLNPASKVGDTSWIKAGKSAWSWWYNGGSVRSYETQKAYGDIADAMDWSYSLLDSGWPRMDGEGMEGVVKYANEKNRGIWLWYHSGAGREDGLGCFFYLCFLDFSGSWPRKVVINDILGVTVITFQSTTDSPHPCHVNRGSKNSKII